MLMTHNKATIKFTKRDSCEMYSENLYKQEEDMKQTQKKTVFFRFV